MSSPARALARKHDRFQQALVVQGTWKRVMVATACLHQLAGDVARRLAAGPWSEPTLMYWIRDRLREMGCDLSDVEIALERTETTIKLRADADDAAQARARRAA